MKLYPSSFVPKTLPLSKYEGKISYPRGIVEEGLLEYLTQFVRVKYCIEIGAGDGTNHSFTKNLIEKHGYSAFLIEADRQLAKPLLEKFSGSPLVTVSQSFVNRDNIVGLMTKAKVPEHVGVLCIDVDGNDYYLWEEIQKRFKADFVCIEYNASFGAEKDFVIPYREDFVWTGDDFYGASFASLVKLGAKAGYNLIHCTSAGDNLIFAHSEIFHLFPTAKIAAEVFYQIPQYGKNGRAVNGKGHPASKLTTSTLRRFLFRLRYAAMGLPRKLVYAAHDPKGHQK